MSEGSSTDYVAWWGAIVATALAAVTLYDRLLRKPLPQTTFMMSGAHEVGNQIALLNTTSIPIMITGWKLYWAQGRGLNLYRQDIIEESDFEELAIETLKPFEHKLLVFAGAQHFGWGYRQVGRGNLYIEVQIAGRDRPVVLHVFNADPDRYGEPLSLRRVFPHSWRPLPKKRSERSALAG